MSTATTSDVFLAPESIPAPAAVDSRPSRRLLRVYLDFTENRVKNALGWLGAQAIRYKPNGRLLGRSPLSRVLDLEALIAGSRARASLFQTLASVATPDQRETYTLSQRAERALPTFAPWTATASAPRKRPSSPAADLDSR